MKIVICEVHVSVSTYGSMDVEDFLKYKRFIAIIHTNLLQISLSFQLRILIEQRLCNIPITTR